MLEETKRLIDAPWSRAKDGLAERAAALQAAYAMRPETPVSGSTAD